MTPDALTATDQSEPMTPDKMNEEYCRPLIGTRFRVRGEPEGFNLRLTEVDSHPAGKRPERFRKPFSLFFLGPRTPVLEQGIHILEADGLPPWHLTVIPILGADPETDGQLYQALFG